MAGMAGGVGGKDIYYMCAYPCIFYTDYIDNGNKIRIYLACMQGIVRAC